MNKGCSFSRRVKFSWVVSQLLEKWRELVEVRINFSPERKDILISPLLSDYGLETDQGKANNTYGKMRYWKRDFVLVLKMMLNWKKKTFGTVVLVGGESFLILAFSIRKLLFEVEIHMLSTSFWRHRCKNTEGMHAHTNTIMPCLAKQIACVAEHVGRVHWEMSLCGDGVFSKPGGKQTALLCVHRHWRINSTYVNETTRPCVNHTHMLMYSICTHICTLVLMSL